MKRIIGKAMTFLLLPLVLTGCWDSVEVNNRSILLEFAIDKNTDYTYDSNVLADAQKVYRMTYAIPDFGKLSGTESLAKDAETTVIVEAPTVASSIDDLEIRSKDTVSFSHVKTILMGEELLKDAELFKGAIGSLSRDMLIARNVPLLAVNGEAGLSTQIENTEQPILGLYVMDYFNNKERPVCFFEKQLLGNFIRQMDETHISTLPVFHIEDVGETDEINISGAALIKDYAFVDYLTKEEVRSQLFVEGKIKNVPIVATFNGKPITYTVKEQQSKKHFKESEEGLMCVVEVNVIGNIAEYQATEEAKLVDKETVRQIEGVIAEEIIKQMRIGIDEAKAMNIDYMEFGLSLYRKHPKLWEVYGPGWEQGEFVKMPIEIGVNVDIESTGIEE
ncbi:MAG: Ger(x)C family spore germination protein [Cellulosilyticaceae bacterium]